MLNLPNIITLIRIALVVVFTVVISLVEPHGYGYLLALLTFVLAACSDWLDGYLARKLNQITTFGKLIDPLADKIAVSAAFIYLSSINMCPAWVSILIISREFMVTGLRQIAQDVGVIIAAGKSGKWKTGFQLAFCIGCLLNLAWTYTPCVQQYTPFGLRHIAQTWTVDYLSIGSILYHTTLWGAVILTVYSALVYSLGAGKFLKK